MAYSFECVSDLLARMNSARNSAATRAAFFEGFAASPIFNFITPYEENGGSGLSYALEQPADIFNTQMPEDYNCDADAPVVGTASRGDAIYFDMHKKNLAIEMCKDDCNATNFQSAYLDRVRAVGAGFGALNQRTFFAGLAREPGILTVSGKRLVDVAASDFADVVNATDPQIVANFFYSLVANKGPNTVIAMGPLLMEQFMFKSFGQDTCGGFMDCVFQKLANMLNKTEAQVKAMFDTGTNFLDFTKGVDALDREQLDSIIVVIDRDWVKMPRSGMSTGCAERRNDTVGYHRFFMSLSGVQVRRDGAMTIAYNVIDQAVIDNAEAERYRGNIPELDLSTVPLAA